MKITCFKAYDIRGKLVEQLDETVAYRIGRAFAEYFSAKTVVVGGDVRLTSAPLKPARKRFILPPNILGWTEVLKSQLAIIP
jgi:phosphomannomutase